MATLIVKVTDGTQVLLDSGKLVLVHEPSASRIDVLRVDDVTYANLVTAYGAVVGS